MRDEYQLEEIAGAVSLGLLASDVVIATSKLLRAADLSEEEREALTSCKFLLQALCAPLDDVRPAARLGQLGSKRSAIDALRAVQVHVPGKDVQDYVRPLANAVEQVLLTGSPDPHRTEMESIRDLFASLSEIEVARATNLSRPTPEEPRWLTSTASLAS